MNSCVNTLIDEISSIDWDVVPNEQLEFDSVSSDIETIKAFFHSPNKNGESFMNIMRAAIKDVLELDAGVIVKVFDLDSYDFDMLEPKSGAPLLKPVGQRRMVELYARDGASFLAETDKFGFVAGYWQYSYQIPAHPMFFSKDEICYLKKNNRSMSPYGYAPTQAILDLVKSLHYSTLYNKRFFEETPMPSGALSLLDTNEQEMKSFITNWNAEFKGQPHKLAVMNKDIKWQPFNITNKELEFLETQQWYYKMVISAFGLTPTELGLTEDSNRATAATQAELTRRKAIRPFLLLLEDYINIDILPEISPAPVKFQFIVDDPVEKSQRLDNWQKELSMGVKTVNDVRTELGMDPAPWGDSPTTHQPVPGSPEQGTEGANDEGKQNEERNHAERGQVSQRREEAKTDRDKRTQDPYNLGRNPVGSFKSADVEKALTTQEKDELIQVVYSRLSQDIYLILQRMGLGVDQSARAAQMLQMRGRVKKEASITCPSCQRKNEPVGGSLPAECFYCGKPLTVKKDYNEMVQHMHDEALKPGAWSYDQFPKIAFDQRRPENGTAPTYQSPNQYRDAQAVQPELRCPACGSTIVEQVTGADDIGGSETFRCRMCDHRSSRQEIIDNAALAQMMALLTQNQQTTPLSPNPRWSPKSCECDVCKAMGSDADLPLEKYIPDTDLHKSLNQSLAYALSEEYLSLLNAYFEDPAEISPIAPNLIVQIMLAIHDGVQNGKTVREIGTAIEKIIGVKDRALVIARTEVARVINHGKATEMQERGVTHGKIVASPEDGRRCEECGKRDGKVYTLKWLKDNIILHPHCRCTYTEFYDVEL